MIKNLLKEFDNSMNKSGIPETGVSSLVIGLEDADASLGQEGLVSLENKVEDALVVGADTGIVFAAHQKRAAALGSAMAMDPNSAVGRELTDPSVKGVVISSEDSGVDDLADMNQVSMEAFDGQAVDSAVRYSFAYNLLASKQDALGEMLFPTIVIDPSASGANVVTRVDNLTEQILRSNSTSDKAKMKKTSIIKAMVNSNSSLSDDKNRLVPVSKAATADVLIPAFEYIEDVTGEDITTAPIQFGKTVPLMGISQTDAMLAKGVMDNTDTLDRRVVVERVYYELTDGTETSNHKFDISAFPFNNFTHTTQDHEKDLGLNFSTNSFIINTDSTKQVDGSDSLVLDGLAADHDIVLRMVLHGNGNAADGDISVYASSVELLEVRNAAGDTIPVTDTAYVDIKAVIDAIAMKGYVVEAYTTNSNLRNLGQLVTVDTYNQVYVVGTRSGITIQKPVTNSFDVENDANYLKSQIMIAGIRTSLASVKKLTDFAGSLRNATSNGVDVTKLELMGAARYLVNPFYKSESIDMTAIVDSVRSAERTDDVKAALISKIKKAVLEAKLASNYGQAFKVSNGGIDTNITVAIATDDTIASYITGDDGVIDIGKGFDVKVESSSNDLMAGKLFITFITNDSSRNEKPNPLNFGQMFWSPEVSAEVTRQVNGATFRALTTNPRFLHVVNLPILVEFNVTGIEAVIGKVVGFRRDA